MNVTKIAGQDRKALANSFYNAISEEQVNLMGRTKIIASKIPKVPEPAAPVKPPNTRNLLGGDKPVYAPIIFVTN